MNWSKPICINIVLLLIASSSCVAAAAIYWSETQVFRQTLESPVAVTMTGTEIDLGSIYGGESKVYAKNNLTELGGFLGVSVFVAPKRLTLLLTNPTALTAYDLFKIELVSYSSPAGSGWTSGQVIADIGFGYSGSAYQKTVTMLMEGAYVFDLRVSVTAGNVTTPVTLRPSIDYSISD